ncbi:MAG TPA: pitrilysin family protein [Thermoanaerobaculia bacterium]|nr:pitrilysin family protein [Thermoanaerobaculia bacterium]
MRRLITSLAIVALITGCTTTPPPAPSPEPAATTAAAAEDFRATAPAPLTPRPYEFPDVTRVTLDNGLRVLVAENRSAPIVTFRTMVRSGAEHDPSRKAGLASFTADALDEGAAGKTALQIAESFGNLGTSFSSWSDWDMSGTGFDVLSNRFEPALALAADVLLRPDFPAADIDRLRQQRLASILQQRDNASIVANQRFASVVYGDTAYGRPVIGLQSTVSGITRSDVQDFYRRHYVPNDATIIITGDIQPAVAVELARKYFSGWARGPAVTPVAVSPAAIDASRIYVIDRPQAVQSEIRVGHPGVARSTEDYFPLLIMNTILGGNFGSRINLNLRERHGYTYGARSSFTWRREPGPFTVSTPVRTEVTLPAVTEIMNELRGIRSGAVTETELSAAKNYQAGIFPSTVESAWDLANRLTDLELYGLPEDYFDHYRERIAAVTEADVQRVANRYLNPDRSAIVIVGKAGAIREPLETLGYPVTVYDIDGNPQTVP